MPYSRPFANGAELICAPLRAERVSPVHGRVDEAEDERQRREVLRPAPGARQVEDVDQEELDELEVVLSLELSSLGEQVRKDFVRERPTARLGGARSEHHHSATEHSSTFRRQL